MQENRAWNRLKDEELIETLKLMEASEIYPAKAQKVYEELKAKYDAKDLPSFRTVNRRLRNLLGKSDEELDEITDENGIGIIDKGKYNLGFKKAKKEGVPMEKVTMSSDGQGSWSNYDAEGKLVEIGVSDVDTIYRQIVYMVKEENMDLEELLALGTKNPAMALELYPKKGAVKEESDADILIMNEDLSLDTVIAMGVPMMRDGKILKKGTYEK